MSKKLSLKESGSSLNQKIFPEIITHEISEINSSFHMKQRTAGKVYF